MELVFHWSQWLTLIVVIVFVIASLNGKPRIALTCLALLVISLIAWPVKTQLKGVHKTLESQVSRFSDVPERITVEEESFSDYQQRNTKQFNKDMNNEKY